MASLLKKALGLLGKWAFSWFIVTHDLRIAGVSWIEEKIQATQKW